jgi:multidrug efflux system outer membrane protein
VRRSTGVRPAFGLALVLSACNVGPDYKAPQLPVPPAYTEGEPVSSAAPPDDLSKWWSAFHDPELDALVKRALAANLDLQLAASRVRQAREEEIIAGAAEWPALNTNGLGLNLHSNSNPLSQLAAGGGGGPPPATPTNIKLYSAGFDASWELDLFGGTRRAVEAAQANAEATQWDLHDVEVTLSAEIANDYLTLRTAQARAALLEAEIKDQRQLLQLVNARATNGFVTQLDVNQQSGLVSNTAAQLPELDAQTRAMIHAIAVLLAEPPEAMDGELQQPRAIPIPPPSLPGTLPSDLLRRRPDIRAAERKLAAATAQEGVAIADLYPKFDLIGAASFTGSALSGLLSANRFGTVGLGFVTWPIFAGGKVHAQIRSSKEAELQAYLTYQQAVLGALRDVEDALARCADDERRVRALSDAESAAASSEAIARQQYEKGLVNFINVLTDETNLLAARDQLFQGRQASAQDITSLYKALGGGWDDTAVDWKTRPPDPENP